jgi:hypothetical protein
MSSPARIEDRTFELAAERAGQARWDLPTRIGSVAVGALAAGVGIYFSLATPQKLPPGVGFRVCLDFVAAAGLFAIGVGLLLRPGPSKILVTGAGVEAVDAAGHRWVLTSWNNPNLRVVLQDARDSLRRVGGYLERRTGIMWVSPCVRGFDLSQEAFDGIVNSARQAGLEVNTIITDTSAGLRHVKVTEIASRH